VLETQLGLFRDANLVLQRLAKTGAHQAQEALEELALFLTLAHD
jgi:hypothetical protein